MNHQLKQCLGVMREVEVAGQKIAECSCCGRRGSVFCVGETCNEFFCIMCGRNESVCTCSPIQQQHEKAIRQTKLVGLHQLIPAGLFTERW